MCVIIHKPAGVKLHEYIYANSFNRNPDGAGFSYVKDGKLEVVKGIMTLKGFMDAIEGIEDQELLIHFRKMSKGKVSEENCHPFLISSEESPEYSYAVVHNGTLSWHSTADRSDTSFFVEQFIKPIIDRDPYFFEFSNCRVMLGAYICSNNKICVMQYDAINDNMAVNIVNRLKGIEYHGCWFSNLSFTEESNRDIADSDHARIKSWSPKLWTEPKVWKGHGHEDEFLDGFTYGRGTTNYTGYTKNPPALVPNKILSGDLRFDQVFGYYSINPNYKGIRCLAEFTAWKEKNAPKKTDANNDKGLPIGLELDPMDYLSGKEHKAARKECVALLKDSYPDFDLKGLSTIELAAWSRAELRQMFPQFVSNTNQQLMNMIIFGDFGAAPEEPSAAEGVKA
jgi:hypothetical protein